MSAITPDDQERVDAIEAALLKRWPENRIAPTLERISALVDALVHLNLPTQRFISVEQMARPQPHG